MLNPRGNPVLAKASQTFIHRCMRLRSPPWIVLSGVDTISSGSNTASLPGNTTGASGETAFTADLAFPDPTPAQAAHMPPSAIKYSQRSQETHVAYLRHLQRTQPSKPPMERFGAGYQDYLQSPLQPLTDNLESITYEVFEKDPVKYEWYERAIAAALEDWAAGDLPGSGPQGRVTIAVVGAGRGPLVDRTLRASETSGVDIDLWALEKNPNAFVHLQRRNVDMWNRRVNLVHSDMRTWKGPSTTDAPRPALAEGAEDDESLADSEDDFPRTMHYTVDILVSELLGSFGDNELSPECIDGVQHVLNPVHGISIPMSYTAHLTPIAAPKLHADITSRAASGDTNATQIPYVVMLQAIDYLCRVRKDSETPNVQEAWEFAHPIPLRFLSEAERHGGGAAANAHNRRETHSTFKCSDRGACHGIAGYFESVLYSPRSGKETVELSTNPVTMEEKCKDMISWFPLYFPLKVRLRKFVRFADARRLTSGTGTTICSRRRRDRREHLAAIRRQGGLVRVAGRDVHCLVGPRKEVENWVLGIALEPQKRLSDVTR